MSQGQITDPNNYNQELKLKGFKVYKTDSRDAGHSYSRKDFYKVNITMGEFRFNYAERSIDTTNAFLFFGNHGYHIPVRHCRQYIMGIPAFLRKDS